jgi:streptogramin lyase
VVFAVWGAEVFFVQQGDETIRRIPIAGGTNEWLADSGGLPCGIAVNADSVFWVTCSSDRRLYRLVR